jgi:hypothetical protein
MQKCPQAGCNERAGWCSAHSSQNLKLDRSGERSKLCPVWGRARSKCLHCGGGSADATWPCCKKKVCAKDRPRCSDPEAVNDSRAGVYKMCDKYPKRRRYMCLHCDGKSAAATWPCCNKAVCICG